MLEILYGIIMGISKIRDELKIKQTKTKNFCWILYNTQQKFYLH